MSEDASAPGARRPRGTRRSFWVGTVLGAVLAVGACSSRTTEGGSETARDAGATVPSPLGVGDPCTPSDEARVQFGGYAVTEVNLETGSAHCASGICLADHFQGRVSCPYGEACTTPGQGQPVSASVPPQLLARRAAETVYCTCRCDGPASDDPFCACPDGFECSPLGPGVGSEISDSYCIRSGSAVADPRTLVGGPTCDAAARNCEDQGARTGPDGGSDGIDVVEGDIGSRCFDDDFCARTYKSVCVGEELNVCHMPCTSEECPAGTECNGVLASKGFALGATCMRPCSGASDPVCTARGSICTDGWCQ